MEVRKLELETVRDVVRTPEELAAYEQAIAGVFKDHLEPTIKRFIIEQEQFMGRQAKDMTELAVGRGTINGLLLLLDEFETATNHFNLSLKKPEKPDGTSMFPEI